MTTNETFTEAEALDEAVLRITRRLRRLHPEAFEGLWAALPDGAKDALLMAEVRADKIRDRGPKEWPAAPTEDDEQE